MSILRCAACTWRVLLVSGLEMRSVHYYIEEQQQGRRHSSKLLSHCSYFYVCISVILAEIE